MPYPSATLYPSSTLYPGTPGTVTLPTPPERTDRIPAETRTVAITR